MIKSSMETKVTYQLSKDGSWIDFVTSPIKKLQDNFSIKYKNVEIEGKSTDCRELKRNLQGKSASAKEFLNVMKREKKNKSVDQNTYLESFQAKIDDFNGLDSGMLKWRINRIHWESQMIIDTIKEHLNEPEHPVTRVLTIYFMIFNRHFKELIQTIKPLAELYEECSNISSGELNSNEITESTLINYAIFKKSHFAIMAEKWFKEVKTFLDSIIRAIPYMYSGLMNKNSYRRVKDEVLHYITANFLRDDSYNILFTFSRIATVNEEFQLLKWINKASRTSRKFIETDRTLLEELYHQIHPDFRIVKTKNSKRNLMEQEERGGSKQKVFNHEYYTL